MLQICCEYAANILRICCKYKENIETTLPLPTLF